MNEGAQIVLRQRNLPLGRSYLEATWEGPRDGLVKVQRIALRHVLGFEPETHPSSLTIDGIRPRLIGETNDDFICDAATYARADGLNIFVWLWLVVSTTVQRLTGWIYLRVILTLTVWGLAHVPYGERPTWRHVGIKK